MRILTSILSLVLFASLSVTAEEDAYLRAGVAATDREWRAADYKNLVALVAEKKVPLPNLTDDDGTKILKRFCSVENLSYERDKTLPLAARMQDAFELQPALSVLMKLYAQEALKGAKVGDESALLMGFLLDMSSVQIELVDEFLPTIKHDSGYEDRMTALQEMKAGLATVFVGAYSSVSQDVLFSDKNRTDILASIVRNAPRFSTVLSADVKAEMIQKFTKLEEKMKEPGDREAITKILAALKG
jgi:hypothetical protein